MKLKQGSEASTRPRPSLRPSREKIKYINPKVYVQRALWEGMEGKGVYRVYSLGTELGLF